MARISQIDWDIIDTRVRAESQRPPVTTASCAVLRLALKQYFPTVDEVLAEIITDGADDRGVDAIHVIEDDDHAEVYLFQSKYRDKIENTDKTINDSEVLKLAVFLEELFDRSESLIGSGNFRLQQGVQKIWSLHEHGSICRYHIVLCSNDGGLSQSAAGILDAVCLKHSQVSYEHYGPRDLIRDFSASRQRHESGDLQVMGKEIFERIDGDVRGAIASIDAKSFVKLISSPDGKSVKRHLFDDNLRIFLGVSGGYNPAIIETATSSDSHLFWYLNNGITITCKNYSFNRGHVNPQIKLTEFQIVNGAQTSHSLLEAFRLNPEALDDVVLMVRVYATDREDIAERVAVATNSQARIQDRDLRANHPILKKLELAFAERGYFFERKRNMHSDKEHDRRIDAFKLGQVITAYYLNEPDRARGESDAIFGSRFFQVFHESYDVDQLCAVTEAIGLVARACSQQKAVAHYQMFRSPKTREKILSEFTGKQGDLFAEVA